MAESNKTTAKRRGPGRPFKKGQSGNPGGRPKGAGVVRELARKYTETAITTLVEICTNEGASESARVAAANALLDRGYGKPIQSMEHTGADGESLGLEVVFKRAKKED